MNTCLNNSKKNTFQCDPKFLKLIEIFKNVKIFTFLRMFGETKNSSYWNYKNQIKLLVFLFYNQGLDFEALKALKNA